jgi:hypothetical protein
VSDPDVLMSAVQHHRHRLSDAQQALSHGMQRDVIVARIILFMFTGHEQRLNMLLDMTNTVDIPDVQASSHRKCASMTAAIRDKQQQLAVLKQQNDEVAFIQSSASVFQDYTHGIRDCIDGTRDSSVGACTARIQSEYSWRAPIVPQYWKCS